MDSQELRNCLLPLIHDRALLSRFSNLADCFTATLFRPSPLDSFLASLPCALCNASTTSLPSFPVPLHTPLSTTPSFLPLHSADTSPDKFQVLREASYPKTTLPLSRLGRLWVFLRFSNCKLSQASLFSNDLLVV